ncbi:hypothetical protein PR048_029281 [Dryococelus australis]|uniref:Uncharacterized protein n=1 Tax=Dryococelus australis TaxID=614101 RepID=A0ABQ9GCY2_9NEOP|nr:hypothetical protein PR048_029281 [Dryococelus australis]
MSSITGRFAQNFRMWESCRTMPLVDGFSRELLFPPPFTHPVPNDLPCGRNYNDRVVPRATKESPGSTPEWNHTRIFSCKISADAADVWRVFSARITATSLYLAFILREFSYLGERRNLQAWTSILQTPVFHFLLHFAFFVKIFLVHASLLHINTTRLQPGRNRGQIPGGVAPEFSQMGIVQDDAAGRWVFSGFSRFSLPLHSDAVPYSPSFTLIGPQSPESPNSTTSNPFSFWSRQKFPSVRMPRDHSAAYDFLWVRLRRLSMARRLLSANRTAVLNWPARLDLFAASEAEKCRCYKGDIARSIRCAIATTCSVPVVLRVSMELDHVKTNLLIFPFHFKTRRCVMPLQNEPDHQQCFIGLGDVVVRGPACHPDGLDSIPSERAPGILLVGIELDNAVGRRGFLGGLPYPPRFHSGAAPNLPLFTLDGSHNLYVKSRPISPLHRNSANRVGATDPANLEPFRALDARMEGNGRHLHAHLVPHD